MHIHQHDAFPQLIQAIRDTFEAGITQNSEAANELAQVLAIFDSLTTERVVPQPQPCPGYRYLAEALHKTDSPIAAPFGQLAEWLRWIQNSNYTSDPKMASFVENYGYTDIIGPRGIIPSNSIASGFMILGPNQLYPPHHHPAIEVYVAVSGHARWQRGEEEWRLLPPGSFIFHPSGVPHATQTLDEPLFALYVWRNHLNTAARLV